MLGYYSDLIGLFELFKCSGRVLNVLDDGIGRYGSP